MPFTVYLPPYGLKNNAMAQCRRKSGFGDLDHAQKAPICGGCPLRFQGETSCNADFLSISEVGMLKEEVGCSIEWVVTNNPGWISIEPAYAEAITALGADKLADPRPLLLRYLGQCKTSDRDPEYWKAWNRLVEWYNAKKFARGIAGSPEEAFVNDMISPRTREGEDLGNFYAAVAVVGTAAERLGWSAAKKVCDALVDACRRAVLAHCPLEVQ
jgi:hypothetical protein